MTAFPATLNGVCDGIAYALGLGVWAGAPAGFTAYPYEPGAPTVPCVFVSGVEAETHRTYRGARDATISLRVLVSAADMLAAQRLCRDMTDPGNAAGLPVALEAARQTGPGNTALWGACDDLVVTAVRASRLYTHGANTYVGADIDVRIVG